MSRAPSAPVRTDGEKLTQEFLLGLPKPWTKAVLKLDATAAMALYGKGDRYAEALAEQGLARSAKNTWCATDDPAAECPVE